MIEKKKVINEISNYLGKINEVISVTFVGSFLKKKYYSDIDIIIIVKKLDKKIFLKCNNAIKNINFKNFGISKKILINNTFGPLKFNTDKNLVIHLMIYSYEDHIDHVTNSPFTCYDWERSKSVFGKNLKDIYPVLKLLNSDFFKKNRGINIYKKNLLEKKINYKKYIFKKDQVYLKQLNYPIHGKDVLEFCFHVILFTSINYLKYFYQKNKLFKRNQILLLIKKISNYKNKKTILETFLDLEKFKKNKKIFINTNDAIKQTFNFLTDFEIYLKKNSINSKKICFKRHLQTRYKKNIFLGQNIDPPIKKKKKIMKVKFEKVFSSPSLRCIQTSKFYSKKILINKFLNEINYGDIEGLTIKNLKITHPNIIKAWKNNKDIKFPNGESLGDVNRRVKNFLNFLIKQKKIPKEKKFMVVTHNVFLRCLVGSYFDIPIFEWYKIDIKYGAEFNFIFNKRLFIDISRTKLKNTVKNIYENSSSH